MLDTALREWARGRLTEIGWADVVVGIPSFNSESTIAHVLKAVSEGMSKYYPGKALLLIVADGGSTDYTREIAQKTRLARGVDKVVTIYRGVPGKGTSARCIFEAALLLEAKACAIFDSDLRSITPEWVRSVISPILDQGYDFVSPFYVRHKYDATITNSIARALTQALYGKRLRQPIGGDFGLSPGIMKFLTKENVWDTDVARFGIDIWMTTVALCEGFKVCETFLGSKIHDPKDPAGSLGPMFRQVVGTMFAMMRRYESAWKRVKGSEAVTLIGEVQTMEPPPVEISLQNLVESFQEGLEHFGSVWRQITGDDRYKELDAIAQSPPEAVRFPVDLWVHTVYDFATAYQRWSHDRYNLVDMLIPIYFARIAGFVNESRDLGTADADKIFDAQAKRFEELKPTLIERWDRSSQFTRKAAVSPSQETPAATPATPTTLGLVDQTSKPA